jgi:formylglycine-generating enzyme required for sulfatase activity
MNPGLHLAIANHLTNAPPDPPSPTEPPASPTRPQPAAATPERLGDYLLLNKVADAAATETWRAMQATVQREVALERLKPEYATNEAALRGFRALVRARAGVGHQYITPVYEAQESDGSIYYTRELVKGRSLADLHRHGVRLDPHQVTSIFLAAAEALSYLDGHTIPHSSPTTESIHLGDDGIPRVDNLALAETDAPSNPPWEIQQIAQGLSVLLHRGMTDSAKAGALLKSAHAGTMQSWPEAAAKSRELLRAISGTALMAPMHSAASTATRPKRSSSIGVILGIVGAIAAAAVGLVFALNLNSAPLPLDFEKMTIIPSGTFQVTSDAAPVDVPEFWIDTYEVTIAQYADFLSALSETDRPNAFDHPDQPKSKDGHEPKQWGALYSAAKKGSTFQGQPIDVNRPVILVDWWDAFAYARWKDRRLPSATEWGRAALGEGAGRAFPWGAKDAPERYNSGVDFNKSGRGGAVDGFNFWSPVDATTGDRSQAGVIGMAGNVSEWVDTWTHHPDFPDTRVPVVMGGSFATKKTNLAIPRPAREPGAAQLAVGFRTASSKAP